MRLLDRYLLREFLAPLGYCLAGFLIFWIAADLFSELHTLQEAKLRGGDIAQYYFFRIPEFLPVVLPVSLLLALLYSLTNHARHNELTAIRAAGVSLGRLCLPYFGIGTAAAMALFVSNEFCAPSASDIAEQLKVSRVSRSRSSSDQVIVAPLDFNNSGAGRFWHITAYNQRTAEMTKPYVEWRTADGGWRSLDAQYAIRSNGVWTFFGVNEIQRTPTNTSFVVVRQKPMMAMPDLTETPEEIKSEIRISYRFKHQTKTHRADVPLVELWNYRRLNPDPKSSIRPWLDTKLQGRFAGPCACLVVILIGVPFAAGTSRRNVFVGVAASIVIFFTYFLLQQIGFALGETGRLPAWIAAWLPNLLFAAAGLCMMTRVR